MPRKSFAETMGSWTRMLDQTRPLLAELTKIAPQHAELEKLLADARRHSHRIKELSAERKLATRLCKEAVAAGTEVRTRMAAFLIQHFGTKSEQLIVFGLRPRPRRIRRRTKAERELATLQKSSETPPKP